MKIIGESSQIWSFQVAVRTTKKSLTLLWNERDLIAKDTGEVGTKLSAVSR